MLPAGPPSSLLCRASRLCPCQRAVQAISLTMALALPCLLRRFRLQSLLAFRLCPLRRPLWLLLPTAMVPPSPGRGNGS